MRQAARAGVFAASPEISILGRVPSIESKNREVCIAKLIYEQPATKGYIQGMTISSFNTVNVPSAEVEYKR